MACYFGAYCLVRSGMATCECGPADCPETNPVSVCGSDGRTYLSACHLRAHACRTQSDIVVQAFGPCGAETPQVRRGSRLNRSASRRSERSHTPSPKRTTKHKLEDKHVKFHPSAFNSVETARNDNENPKSAEGSELTCVDILPPVGYR
ncbi:hypothetical protein JYU34_003426 [Plutella xylostella]|uniref:Kazal-like domain-containing protein n=1 Tax=Plutella xylostella TaxID=51655 RepID=A0ABQ7R010_PLUXY|nr:hypothetical protein JYU34_003426 [Plutella xylostella]